MVNAGGSLPANVALSPQASGALQNIVQGLLGAVQKFNIAEITVANGSMVDIEVDKVVLGSATVGHLVLQGTTMDVKSGSAFLENVRVVLELDFSFDWWVNLGFWSPSGSDSLGSISIPVNLGNIAVPSLQNIPLVIPTLATTQPVSATIVPLTSLNLGGGTVTGITATKTAIPASGFQLSGMGIGGVSVASVQVPQTTVAKVTVQDFHPNGNIVVPSMQMAGIQLPAAQAANIDTTAPINFDADMSRAGLSFDLGVVGGTIWVTPIAHIGIGSMLLQGVTVSATVPSATLQDISVPVDVRGINLTSVTLGQVDVTNVSL
jgi:hypothetical protein